MDWDRLLGWVNFNDCDPGNGYSETLAEVTSPIAALQPGKSSIFTHFPDDEGGTKIATGRGIGKMARAFKRLVGLVVAAAIAVIPLSAQEATTPAAAVPAPPQNLAGFILPTPSSWPH